MLIRVKSGENEVQLESEKESIEAFIEIAVATLERLGNSSTGTTKTSTRDRGSDSPLDVSLNVVVSRLGGGSARALLKAAAIHLGVVDHKLVFTRGDLISRAQEARDWQASYKINQSRDLKRMIDAKELIEKSSGHFAVPSKLLDEASRVLADG